MKPRPTLKELTTQIFASTFFAGGDLERALTQLAELMYALSLLLSINSLGYLMAGALLFSYSARFLCGRVLFECASRY